MPQSVAWLLPQSLALLLPQFFVLDLPQFLVLVFFSVFIQFSFGGLIYHWVAALMTVCARVGPFLRPFACQLFPPPRITRYVCAYILV